VQNALLRTRQRVSQLVIPWCTYTDPEIAHVGLYVRQARQRGIPVKTYTVPMHEVDRAISDGEEEGFVKVHVKAGSDRILGGLTATMAPILSFTAEEIYEAMPGVKAVMTSADLLEQKFDYIGPERVAVGRVRSQSVFNLGGRELTLTQPNRFQVNYHDSPEFDLTFRSTLDVFLPLGGPGANCTEGAHAEVTMPEFIHLTYADVLGYHGLGGKYHYETTPRGQGRCYRTWSGSGDAPFEVVGGRIEGDLSLGQLPQITLPIRIGDSIEKAQGPALAFPPLAFNSFWSLWWKMPPRPEQAPKPDFTIPVTDWEYVGSTPGTVFARKRWPSNCGGRCTEETNMSLILKAPP